MVAVMFLQDKNDHIRRRSEMRLRIFFCNPNTMCSINIFSVHLKKMVFPLSYIFFTGLCFQCSSDNKKNDAPKVLYSPATDSIWHAPDSLSITDKEIAYGRDLIAHTAKYLGPNGSIMQISNGMNCQNCHLKAGTKVFGNNYSAVASTYPKFRARSGGIESVEKRINDCIQRSLNGKPLTSESRELKSIVAYINWVGSAVRKGVSPKGSGLVKVPLMNRAADPQRGKILYASKCAVCHGKDGDGKKNETGSEYQYPPLWGEHSYNTGAGLFRLSRFAGYVKANMPNGTNYDQPVLTDEEAWDLAAFVNSMPRPRKDFAEDWPDVNKKPFDHPFGPYADSLSEQQHKFGPWAMKE